MKRIIAALSLAALVVGCASSHHTGRNAPVTAASQPTNQKAQPAQDARTVRGILNSLASPASRMPANVPQ